MRLFAVKYSRTPPWLNDMLLPDNIHPENTIYYQGSHVLQSLGTIGPASFSDLFVHVNQVHKLTMPVFILCMDWLYLVGVVDFDNSGRVSLCS